MRYKETLAFWDQLKQSPCNSENWHLTLHSCYISTFKWQHKGGKAKGHFKSNVQLELKTANEVRMCHSLSDWIGWTIALKWILCLVFQKTTAESVKTAFDAAQTWHAIQMHALEKNLPVVQIGVRKETQTSLLNVFLWFFSLLQTIWVCKNQNGPLGMEHCLQWILIHHNPWIRHLANCMPACISPVPKSFAGIPPANIPLTFFFFFFFLGEEQGRPSIRASACSAYK